MKIVCIGSGNVGTHMANAFKENEADIVQVWSKDPANAAALAFETGAQAIADLEDIDLNADLYLIAVKDDAIAKLVRALKAVNGLVVHTSGATDMNVLSGIKNYGVFYPLQTFSKEEPIDFIHVPLCLEANSAENLSALRLIAVKLSPLIYEVNSEKRKILHLAGVFACNFVNHMYRLSQQIVEKQGLDFEILRPLIMETAVKAQNALPEDVQTGPAARNDKQTILKHEELLQKLPHLLEIYKILSNSIKKTR
ncbi:MULTISPECIES: Rossmann-like and DUF2520 domain-containing protein [Pedobacter]|uniref:Oxidoreductase domain protein n=1 Tax=Pedobacter heparinus (strain ATCC 13125 / DSM 2366 / CIP 104194 / JCM 7457 / NBRC 12017 / NCIMB 9290 / NRRL B-14731 / HIM 762-3) TaxID=485917 RepID=C6Y3W8_PEDHD|nr:MULTISPECIES: DUF2520 domain-containing protein [Pedobacter]ACU05411.1 oxidoreductase domain protein [Pedobacter heparinus DSM 2366]MBB5439438.1 putative short-subunit dehydrogenase-like oxidoreductase (DUF2520 family) [Pedobacter sp. AK017]